MSRTKRRHGIAAAAAVVLVGALPTAAAADAPRRPGHAAAEATLEAAAAAITGGAQPGNAGGAAASTTLAMRDLALALPKLERRERREAKAILARPTDNPDPLGDAYAAPEEPPFCSAHFCVHYVASTADAPDLTDSGGVAGVPDYVEQVASVGEQSYATENGPLGWPPPRSDGALGGGAGLTDVYLANVGSQGIFGYTAPDPPPAQSCVRSCFAYLVLDDDYSPAEFNYPDPSIPLSVTMAHEYNHVLQFGIDAIQDGWLFESTAVWAEEKVFPAANDYVSYIGPFAATPGTPITDFTGARGLRPYGAATFSHWLDAGGGGYGPGVIVDTWLSSTASNPKDFAVGAYDRSISAAGGNDFSREFSKFAAASAEWRTGHGGFPDAAAYRDVKRKGKLRRARRARRIELDHAAYRLLAVAAGNANKLVLRVRAEEGVRTGIALIGRDGGATTGAVTRKSRFLKKGGKGKVKLRRARRFERVTAAIVNADGRVRGFGISDWIYRKENAEFKARLGG